MGNLLSSREVDHLLDMEVHRVPQLLAFQCRHPVRNIVGCVTMDAVCAHL